MDFCRRARCKDSAIVPAEKKCNCGQPLDSREQTLRLVHGNASSLPSALAVNGIPFLPPATKAPTGTYRGPAQQRVSFVSLTVDQGPKGGGVPREVTISGRRYLRRCENYFLPLDADAKDVEALFDHMASRYDAVTDAALNCLVSRRLLERAMRHGLTARDDVLRVADFGCGSGATWREWQALAGSKPDYRLIQLSGCDLSEKMVALSHRCGFSRAFRCDYARTEFASDFFDVVLVSFVMHYFNDGRPIHEIARILKPGGLLLAALPSAERKELHRYRAMLRNEVSLGRIRSSEMRTATEQPRRIPILRCEKLSASTAKAAMAEADHPDEPSLV